MNEAFTNNQKIKERIVVKLFRIKKNGYGLMEKKVKISMYQIEERLWVLDMYRRKGCIIDRYSLKDGK